MLSAAPASAAASLATVIPPNVNISRMRGNQSEGTVAIDPHNPKRIFALSNIEVGDGLFSARSTDGGATWSKRLLADGRDNLYPASCDPTAVFDDFGNLFVAYLNAEVKGIELAMSTNGGRTFTRLTSFTGQPDQPTITAGAGSLWITFEKNNRIMATGAKVSALGRVGKFQRLQTLPGSQDGNFGDIAIGRNGQVLVTYLTPTDDRGPARIYTNLDRDGLGSATFGKAVLVASTNVGGFRPVAAQRVGMIDAEPGLAFDRSGATRSGRVYIIYTHSSSVNGNDTDVYLRCSNDSGLHWSQPQRVNDDGAGNSQFLPRIALDQSTGNVGISWYDSRKIGQDPGAGPTPNVDAQFWGVLGHPTRTGLSLDPNFRISQGTSNSNHANNSIDFGDYTGLAFNHNLMMPIWSDNSNSTHDNPNGTLHELDMYIARIQVPGSGSAA